jgi:hypothetical protein
MVQPATISPLLPYAQQGAWANEKNTQTPTDGEVQSRSWMRAAIKVAGTLALIGGVYAGISYWRSREAYMPEPCHPPELPAEFFELLERDTSLEQAISYVEKIGKDNLGLVGPAFYEIHKKDVLITDSGKRTTLAMVTYLNKHMQDNDIVSQEAAKVVVPLTIDDHKRTPLYLISQYIGKEDPFSQSIVDTVMDKLLERPHSYKLHRVAELCIREKDAACQRAVVNTFDVISKLEKNSGILQRLITMCQTYENPVCKDFVL